MLYVEGFAGETLFSSSPAPLQGSIYGGEGGAGGSFPPKAPSFSPKRKE